MNKTQQIWPHMPMLHKSKKDGTPPKSQHPWGEKVYVRLHKNSTRDAYDRITQFIIMKRKWMSGADRSDRSHIPVRPVCPRQPAKNITSNNLHHTITISLR